MTPLKRSEGKKALPAALLAAAVCLLLVFVASGTLFALQVRGAAAKGASPEPAAKTQVVVPLHDPEAKAEEAASPDKEESGQEPSESPAEKSEEQETDAEPRYYTAQCGDHLTGIAEAHGVTVCELIRANPEIKNPNLIFVGQVIKVP